MEPVTTASRHTNSSAYIRTLRSHEVYQQIELPALYKHSSWRYVQQIGGATSRFRAVADHQGAPTVQPTLLHTEEVRCLARFRQRWGSFSLDVLKENYDAVAKLRGCLCRWVSCFCCHGFFSDSLVTRPLFLLLLLLSIKELL